MRYCKFAMFLVVLAALVVAPATAGKKCTMTMVQYGFESASLEADNYFQMRGAGFKTSSPAKVCVTGQLCRKSDVDSDGTFVQSWSLDYPGTYVVNVYQQRGHRGGKSYLAYSGTLTIVAE